MTYDERVSGLIQANNLNVQKRRALANFIRDYMYSFPTIIKQNAEQVLKENGPNK